MKKFRVSVRAEGEIEFYIEAMNEAKAEAKAEKYLEFFRLDEAHLEKLPATDEMQPDPFGVEFHVAFVEEEEE